MAAWERAFTEVVAHRGDALLRYAYLLCGDSAEAADRRSPTSPSS